MFLINHIFESFYGINSIIFNAEATKYFFKSSFFKKYSVPHSFHCQSLSWKFQKSCKNSTSPVQFPLFLIPFVSYNRISAYNLPKKIMNCNSGKNQDNYTFTNIYGLCVWGFACEDIYHFHLCQVLVYLDCQILEEELKSMHSTESATHLTHAWPLAESFLKPPCYLCKCWCERERSPPGGTQCSFHHQEY